MEVPQKNVKVNRFEAIREWFENFKKACKELIVAFNAEAEEYIEMGAKDAQLSSTWEKIDEQANNRFEKDEDGYTKIPNKLEGIEAKVSEEKAVQEGKQRQKEGKQKTRVEED